MTKVWGLDEPVGPLQFSQDGWRGRAIHSLLPGDLVLLVATQDEPTKVEERGRLLGLMQPTILPVMSLDYPLRRSEFDYDPDGKYKWPFGLVNANAWILEDQPRLAEIFQRRFGRDSALGIVPLDLAETAAVMALRRRPAALLQPSAATQARIDRAVGKRMSAPPPHTTRAGIMHMRSANAATYIFEVAGSTRPSFKVGWAFDPKARRRVFNQMALPDLGGLRYDVFLSERWRTAREAFRMEQTLLDQFRGCRHPANREILHGVSKHDLQQAWIAYVSRNR